mmetsp:Transcript_94713/g.283840  ORF Transcript_94713/g.283840 Transcript_94713/m.283840 type:complete len:104 (+) Transcript_94713:3-314(+)
MGMGMGMDTGTGTDMDTDTDMNMVTIAHRMVLTTPYTHHPRLCVMVHGLTETVTAASVDGARHRGPLGSSSGWSGTLFGTLSESQQCQEQTLSLRHSHSGIPS